MAFLTRSLLGLAILGILGCNASRDTVNGSTENKECDLSKIQFSLDDLDENGLIGPAIGKVALDYEFCIPMQQQHKDSVLRIDPSIRVSQNKGRIGCGTTEYICIGNTHRPDHREVLCKLSKLPFVERIDRTVWE